MSSPVKRAVVAAVALGAVAAPFAAQAAVLSPRVTNTGTCTPITVKQIYGTYVPDEKGQAVNAPSQDVQAGCAHGVSNDVRFLLPGIERIHISFDLAKLKNAVPTHVVLDGAGFLNKKVPVVKQNGVNTTGVLRLPAGPSTVDRNLTIRAYRGDEKLAETSFRTADEDAPKPFGL